MTGRPDRDFSGDSDNAPLEPWTAGPRAQWIQVDTEGHAFVCQRCGLHQAFVVPVRLVPWVEAGQVFVKTHIRCGKPAKIRPVESVQSSLL